MFDCSRLVQAAAGFAALLLCAAPAKAGDPETCRYDDEALAQACRERPEIREYLLEPYNITVETYQDIPPVVRGWMPGEEEAVIRAITDMEAGCGYTDPDLALACRLDEEVHEALKTVGTGPETSWFALPFDIGGWAPPTFDKRRRSTLPGADQQRFRWMMDAHRGNGDRIREIEGAVGRAIRQKVRFSRLYLVAVDGRHFVACGYAFTDGGGYEPPTSGRLIFDTQGGSALRAPRDLFNAKCGLFDAVLR